MSSLNVFFVLLFNVNGLLVLVHFHVLGDIGARGFLALGLDAVLAVHLGFDNLSQFDHGLNDFKCRPMVDLALDVLP